MNSPEIQFEILAITFLHTILKNKFTLSNEDLIVFNFRYPSILLKIEIFGVSVRPKALKPFTPKPWYQLSILPEILINALLHRF